MACSETYVDLAIDLMIEGAATMLIGALVGTTDSAQEEVHQGLGIVDLSSL
ncbi:MAG: hypothetical protein GX271_04385 [Clostridiales bacterium]|jgi:hypothetical protein|nr:hypothetical protein [Clostridiales bacterium]